MKTLLAFLTLFVTSQAFANKNLEELAGRLISLRADVEALNQELQSKKEDYQGQLKSMMIQKTELEASIQKEGLKSKQLNGKLAEVTQLIEKTRGTSDKKKLLLGAAKKLEEHLQVSIPYKKTERIGSLKEISEKLESGVITEEKAMAQLWQFVEDELRLAKENTISQETISLDSREMLATVAKLGNIALFFQTQDGKYGYLEKNGASYQYKETLVTEQKNQIKILIDSMKKQIRVGQFEIPNAILSEGVNK